MSNVELCGLMLQHAVWAKATEDKTAGEVKTALKFFFTADEIEQAIALISGRATDEVDARHE